MFLEVGIFIIGLVLGSFLNVCIYRLPRNESIIKPRSHCPHCGKTIAWYDNIPLLSYLILKAKCRYCQKKISLRYPIVELLSALLLLALYKAFGISFYFFEFLILGCGLIIATFTDFEHQIIPDQISIGLIPVGFILSFFKFMVIEKKDLIFSLLNPLLAIAWGAFLIYATGILGKILFHKESMGMGDVKLMAMIGAFLGWKNVILTYFIAPFIGIFYGLYLKLRYKKEYLPYGPFLSLASFITIFWGSNIFYYLYRFKI